MAITFYRPALQQTGGIWPAPLDDSYIYYGFARSTALGYPLQWVAGNGYSSGATSPLYPLLLAPLWAIGLRGHWLGLGAALLAIASLLDLSRSLRALMRGRLAAWLAPAFVVCVPLLCWSWFSGMEVALFGAICGRALLNVQYALRCDAPSRRRAQWRAGGWLALLALARPEAIALVATLAVALAHGGRSLSAIGSLLRAGLPAAVVLLLQAGLNLAVTGEMQPAGALRKLWATDPFAPVSADVLGTAKNLLVLIHQALVRAFGGSPWVLLALLLWSIAVWGRGHRRLARACLLGALGMVLLVSLNSTARFQNYRYAAPALLLGCCVMAMGCDTLRRRPRLALLLTLPALLAPLRELPRQQHHFALASRNIAEQHVVVAAKLRALRPLPRRVLVGDAGAIPYLSELPALDGLGLGGYRRLPFARASRQGIGCVIELIERLPEHERPDVMALYPGWWPGLADRFGTRIDSVRIRDNVICAADEKVIYRSDFSALAPAAEHGRREAKQHNAEQRGARSAEQHNGNAEQRGADAEQRDAAPAMMRDGGGAAGAWLRLDVADLIDERRHRYRMQPPAGGRVIAATRLLDGRPRWDAGRVHPEGTYEQLTIPNGRAPGPAQLIARSDGDSAMHTLHIEIWRNGERVTQSDTPLSPQPANANTREPPTWRTIHVPLPEIRAGDQLRLSGHGGDWRSFQLWLRDIPLSAAHQ